MEKEYIHEVTVIGSTNSLIWRTDMYCILRNYSKDDFSLLPGKAHIWYKLVDPMANHHAKVLQTLLKHAFIPNQLCLLLEQVKKYLTVIKMRWFHSKSEDCILTFVDLYLSSSSCIWSFTHPFPFLSPVVCLIPCISFSPFLGARGDCLFVCLVLGFFPPKKRKYQLFR